MHGSSAKCGFLLDCIALLGYRLEHDKDRQIQLLPRQQQGLNGQKGRDAANLARAYGEAFADLLPRRIRQLAQVDDQIRRSVRCPA